MWLLEGPQKFSRLAIARFILGPPHKLCCNSTTGRESPSAVQGSGDEVPRKLKNFWSSYKQILCIFGSISHIFTYICLCFSVLAGITPLSLWNVEWGIWYRLPPPPCLQVGGNCPPPPAPPPMVNRMNCGLCRVNSTNSARCCILSHLWIKI